MKIRKLFLIALGLFTFSIQLRAQEEKDPIEIQMDAAMEENGSTAGMVDAITEAQAKWESKLNATYKSLKKKMSADEFAALQQAQRAWIAYRDSKSNPTKPPTPKWTARCGFPYTQAR